MMRYISASPQTLNNFTVKIIEKAKVTRGKKKWQQKAQPAKNPKKIKTIT